MNNFKITSLSLLLLLSSSQSFGQIKINLSGEIKIGNEWPNNDYNNEISIEAFGLNSTNYRPGAKFSFGDYGASVNYGANVFIGELGTTDTDALQLNGKNGIYFTTGGSGNYEVARFTSGGTLEVRGAVNANSSLYSSDMRLKKNIKSLGNSLLTIKQLRGISFDWKTDADEELLTNLQAVKTSDEKYARDLEKTKKEIQDRIKDANNQLGFSAQEVQAVLPQLVNTGSNGMLSVNYVSIIPILVEGIKEQQVIINAQQTEIYNLKKDIAAIKKKLGME